MPRTPATVHAEPPLFMPDVLTVQLTVGVVRSSGHLQWSIQVTSSTDDVLISMLSVPHREMASVGAELEQMRQRLYEQVLEACWSV